MSERHIVQCDWCGKQANMVVRLSGQSAFPAGWWRYKGESSKAVPDLNGNIYFAKTACPACATYIKLVKECGLDE